MTTHLDPPSVLRYGEFTNWLYRAFMDKIESNHQSDADFISGFGGEYEQACRDMAEAGAEWLGKHPGIVKEWMEDQDEYMKRTGKDYYPLHERPKSYREFEQAVLSVCEDCTGAMFGAAKGHAISIAERGWDGHCKFVLDARKDEAK